MFSLAIYVPKNIREGTADEKVEIECRMLSLNLNVILWFSPKPRKRYQEDMTIRNMCLRVAL
jgi:hypothetical protein